MSTTARATPAGETLLMGPSPEPWRAFRALARQDLRLRVAGSRLGIAWLILQPLLYLALTTVVFFGVLGVRFEGGGLASFAFNLVGGLVAWLGFNEGLGKAAPSLSERSHLIRNAPLPRAVIPLVPLVAAVAYQAVCLAALLIVSAVRGTLGPEAFLLLPGLVLEMLLLAGLAWIVAALTVCYRDLQYLLSFVLMAWLYLTPIFYPPASVPQPLVLPLIYLNPLALVVVIFRGALFGGAMGLNVWVTLAAISAAVAFIGYVFFKRLESALVDLL